MKRKKRVWSHRALHGPDVFELDSYVGTVGLGPLGENGL